MSAGSKTKMLAAAGLGAGVMYWLDPLAGRRRRARLGQKAVSGAHQLGDGAARASRDIAHRSEGMLARAVSGLRKRSAPDEIIVERVRARLGRVSSHPHGIEVFCRDGIVELRGPIARAELRRVVSAVARVRGVRRLHDALTPHDLPSGPVAESNWPPAARLLGITVGLALLLGGIRARGAARQALRAAGLALLGRGALNRPWRRVFGIGPAGGRRAVDVRKTINVRAPIEEVFALLSAFETFPRFMTHVREVKKLDEGIYHWRVEGPGGSSFAWDAEVTRVIPNELVAWRSRPGASVHSSGVVRFERTADGTKVDVRLAYSPPGGMIGHGVARLLGADPRKEMNDDLLRFKSLVELGKATGHERVTRDEIAKAAEHAGIPKANAAAGRFGD